MSIFEILVTSAAGVIVASYLPKALDSSWHVLNLLWKYIILPIGRFVSFPAIRFYRDRYKKYEIRIMKFYVIDSLWKEFFFDWYRWVRFGGRYPMSHKEEKRFLEYQKELKKHEENVIVEKIDGMARL